MTAYHYYTLMHGKGHTHWLNMVAEIFFGAAWPIAMLYGIYVVHFERT